jgi:hypothetical protein
MPQVPLKVQTSSQQSRLDRPLIQFPIDSRNALDASVSTGSASDQVSGDWDALASLIRARPTKSRLDPSRPIRILTFPLPVMTPD